MPYLASYIFLRDPPERLRPPAKFFARHEVGHTLRSPQFVRSFLWLANRGLWLALPWIAWNLQWSWPSGLSFAALVTTTVALRLEVRARIARFRLADEIAADAFALSTLSRDELPRLAHLATTQGFLTDPKLSAEDNATRQGAFRENLRRLQTGDTKLYANIEDLSKLPISAITASLLLILLGQFSKPPTIAFMKVAGFAALLPLIAVLAVCAIALVELGSRIEGILGAPGRQDN